MKLYVDECLSLEFNLFFWFPLAESHHLMLAKFYLSCMISLRNSE